MRKPVSGLFPTRSCTTTEMARDLKFEFRKKRDCTTYAEKTKALICAYVFAYAKSRFSHYMAHSKTLMIILG